MKIAVIIESLNDLEEIIQNVNTDLLYEFRIDLDKNLIDEEEKINEAFNPNQIIYTLRSETEGGKWNKSRDYINQILSKNFKYLDLELYRDQDKLKKALDKNKTIILSNHNYKDSMANAAKEYYNAIPQNLLNNNDIIFKFVGNSIDTLDALEALDYLKNKIKQKIILSTNKNGELLRVGNFSNNFLVFGSRTQNQNYLDYKLLKDSLNFDFIKVGLLGEQLSYSLSPYLHSLFLRNAKLKGHYHLLEANDKERAIMLVERIAKLNFKGINITTPYKGIFFGLSDFIDYKSPEVYGTNSINFLKFKDDEVFADNTDVKGFEDFIENNKLDHFKSANILGAGGAARSVAFELLRKNFEVNILFRNETRIEEFPEEIRKQLNFIRINNPSFKEKLPKTDLFINASTISMNSENPNEYIPFIKGNRILIDLFYSRNKTPLVELAHSLNLKSYDGKEMLYFQGREAFRLWTGKLPQKNLTLKQFLDDTNG